MLSAFFGISSNFALSGPRKSLKSFTLRLTVLFVLVESFALSKDTKSSSEIAKNLLFDLDFIARCRLVNKQGRQSKLIDLSSGPGIQRTRGPIRNIKRAYM